MSLDLKNFLGNKLKYHSERNDGRKGSPTLSVEQWDSRLRQGSFSGVNVSIPDYSESAQQMTLMISKAVSPAPTLHSVSIISNPEYENTHSSISQSLGELVEHRYACVNFENLPLKEVEDNKTYVVIDDDRDRPMTDSKSWLYTGMKDLFQRAQNVLWVAISYHPGNSRRECKLHSSVPCIFQHGNAKLKLVRVEIPHLVRPSDLSSKILEVMRVSFFDPPEYRSKETEYIYTDDSVLIPRWGPSSKLRQELWQRNTKTIHTGSYRHKDRPLKLDQDSASSVDKDLHFDEYQFEEDLAPSDIEVEVHAWGLISHALLAKTSLMIGEFSGRVVNVGSDVQDVYQIGDRVCCWDGDAYSSFCRVDATKACFLPDSVPFSIAASIPVNFSCAYHALVELADLTKGQTVVIHTATEGIGEAAVQIAQHIGAKVIVTADGAATQDLANVFGLPKNCVLSGTSDIAWHVRVLTEGRGADVIFDTTEDGLYEENSTFLKPFARYIQFRKPEWDGNRKGFAVSPGRDYVFCSFTFEALIKHRSLEVREHMRKLLTWFDNGLLKPLHNLEIRDISEVAHVYSSVQRGLNSSKYVLEITNESAVRWTAKRKVAGDLSKNASWILAGNLGQWGLAICHYMASRKAQYVALLTWTMRESEQLSMFENELRRLGISVRVILLTSFDEDLIRSTIFHALEGWPVVKGVIEADMLRGVRCERTYNYQDFAKLSAELNVRTCKIWQFIGGHPVVTADDL